MTSAEELWRAVVAHCKPGRGYRIGVAGSRLTLSRESKPEVYVEPDATGGWSLNREAHDAPEGRRP